MRSGFLLYWKRLISTLLVIPQCKLRRLKSSLVQGKLPWSLESYLESLGFKELQFWFQLEHSDQRHWEQCHCLARQTSTFVQSSSLNPIEQQLHSYATHPEDLCNHISTEFICKKYTNIPHLPWMLFSLGI